MAYLRKEIKVNDQLILVGNKKEKAKYYVFEVKAFKKNISLKEALGECLNINISELPEHSDFSFKPRRKPTDSPILYSHLTIRKRQNNTISVRFRLYPEFRPDDWDKPYNIDTYFLEAKKLTKPEDNIRFIFLSNKDNWIRIKILDVVVRVCYNKESTIGSIIETAYAIIIGKIKLTDDKVDIVGKIRNVLQVWDKQDRLDEEEYWQNILKSNSWIISQSLSIPEVLFVDKPFIGGKSINNRAGKIVDFAFQNEISKNLTFIELKTPNSRLIGQKYRGVYSISQELSGAIIQLLDYKETAQRFYLQTVVNSNDLFQVFAPTIILITGSTIKLSEEELYSFEIFRREMKNIQIITYNELFEKIRILHNLLSNDMPGGTN